MAGIIKRDVGAVGQALTACFALQLPIQIELPVVRAHILACQKGLGGDFLGGLAAKGLDRPIPNEGRHQAGADSFERRERGARAGTMSESQGPGDERREADGKPRQQNAAGYQSVMRAPSAIAASHTGTPIRLGRALARRFRHEAPSAQGPPTPPPPHTPPSSPYSGSSTPTRSTARSGSTSTGRAAPVRSPSPRPATAPAWSRSRPSGWPA
jgi:hypothetical protein